MRAYGEDALWDRGVKFTCCDRVNGCTHNGCTTQNALRARRQWKRAARRAGKNEIREQMEQ